MQLTKEITSKPAGKKSEDSKAVVEALKGNIERSQRTLADLKAQVHSKGRLADPNINIEELMSEKAERRDETVTLESPPGAGEGQPPTQRRDVSF